MRKENLIQEEISAQQFEARKSSAEAEFLIICNDKKNLLSEIDTLSKKVIDSKSILEKNNSEIKATENNLEIVRNLYINENNSLQKISENRKIVEKDFEDFKKSSEIKKTEISDKIFSLDDNHSIRKNASLKELGDLDIEKKSLLNIIAEKNDSLINLKKQESDVLKKIDDLDIVYKNFLDKINITQSELEKVVDDISQQKKNLKTVQEAIKISDSIFLSKQEEIKKIDLMIISKNEEYKKEESKLFTIVQKGDLLAQKEAFIKNQFERAGIKWQD